METDQSPLPDQETPPQVHTGLLPEDQPVATGLLTSAEVEQVVSTIPAGDPPLEGIQSYPANPPAPPPVTEVAQNTAPTEVPQAVAPPQELIRFRMDVSDTPPEGFETPVSNSSPTVDPTDPEAIKAADAARAKELLARQELERHDARKNHFMATRHKTEAQLLDEREASKKAFLEKVMEARRKAAAPPPPTQPVPPAVLAQTQAEIAEGKRMQAIHAERAGQRVAPPHDPREGNSVAVFRPGDYVPDQKKGQGNTNARPVQ